MESDFPYLDEDTDFPFPPPGGATPEGIVAAGGNLSPGMLLSAYRRGIFPWFTKEEPILWWSPDPRCVLFPSDVHVSRSMRRVLNRGDLAVTVDERFDDVIEACRIAPRRGQDGTWITRGMRHAYSRLHRLGYAHSIEVTRQGKLAGGLYGISLGRVFFGESMFSGETNASKVALIRLAGILRSLDFTLIDCQVHSPHLESLGARLIPRRDFLRLIEEGVRKPPADLAAARPSH
jgi:leucyl/phenylalanyl-tRNA--protein transferase